MKPQEIILRPIQTEKSSNLKGLKNIVCFEVLRNANKIEVKKAVEKLFGVKVEEVKIVNLKRKPKAYGRYRGYRPGFKKAYVRLKEGEKTIEFFEGA
jgi:large subunit ribosomal protein L23